MKDISKRELGIGDWVSFCMVGYSRLRVGEVVKITPRGVTINYTSTFGSNICSRLKTINRSSAQVSRIN